MFLQQDEEFSQDRNALEMELREQEARFEMVSQSQCFPFKPSSKIATGLLSLQTHFYINPISVSGRPAWAVGVDLGYPWTLNKVDLHLSHSVPVIKDVCSSICLHLLPDKKLFGLLSGFLCICVLWWTSLQCVIKWLWIDNDFAVDEFIFVLPFF